MWLLQKPQIQFFICCGLYIKKFRIDLNVFLLSRNTTMDSGINMDVSTTSVGNISRELKEENNVSLPTIQENGVS